MFRGRSEGGARAKVRVWAAAAALTAAGAVAGGVAAAPEAGERAAGAVAPEDAAGSAEGARPPGRAESALAPPPADPRFALPRVELARRLPARWVRDDADQLALEPARWRRRLPRECRTRGGYRAHCQGERRVPTPHGEAARLADHLGLGHRATALQILHDRPLPEWVRAAAGLDPEPRLTFPVSDGRLGRGFGHVRGGSLRRRRHKGVDIAAPEGAAVVAARGGLVVYADDGLTGYGNSLLVLHEDGHSTLYAHCRAVHAFAGQDVARGQHVADVGATGFATAPHLHFEWRERGWPRDPTRAFLRRE